MKMIRAALLVATAFSLAACAPGYRSTGSGGSAATAPTTSQAGASDSWQWDQNTGAGAP